MSDASPRIIDTKLPLTWLLTSAGAIVLSLGTTLWTVASQSNKLDQVLITATKLEKRLDDRDTKTEDLREKMFAFERSVDNLKLRTESMERELRSK